ncbi:hypothetical protein H0G86_002152 [Trichoderma simmonsii]|uniref:Uncharacterized protein n=1 Tax=Trichoderma simmonsii TaxID=1491479 RepID=A0A8G0PB80_9HYPO|nr:hypothetical protein H0G86_002152 [Trichoderma simmonsii]
MTAALLHLLEEIPVEVPGVREGNGPHIVHLFNYMTSAYTFNARLYTGPTSTGSSRASLSLVLSLCSVIPSCCVSFRHLLPLSFPLQRPSVMHQSQAPNPRGDYYVWRIVLFY